MSTLRDDWREFIATLEQHGVDYLVIGGVAVGAHGHVRYTKDMDVWYRATEENAERLTAALRAFGFPVTPPIDQLIAPKKGFQLGVEPTRIDLLSYAEALDFDSCFARRLMAVIDGTPISVIGLDDLRTNKRAVGRLQDLADLDDLDETRVWRRKKDEIE